MTTSWLWRDPMRYLLHRVDELTTLETASMRVVRVDYQTHCGWSLDVADINRLTKVEGAIPTCLVCVIQSKE